MCSDQEKETLHILTWTIKNFGTCTLKNGEYLDSSIFMAESLDGTTWFARLYPRGKFSHSNKFACFLHRSDNCTGPYVVKCNFIIEAIDENNKSLTEHNLVTKFKKGEYAGPWNFFDKNLILNMRSFDALTIKIKLRKILPTVFTENSCCTKIVADHWSFKWKVKNSCFAVTKPIFFSENLLFEITFSVSGFDIEISIRKTMGIAGSRKLICAVTLMDLKGKEGYSKEAIFNTDDPGKTDTWKFPTFLNISKIFDEEEKYVEDYYFTLKFDFTFSDGKTVESCMNNIQDNQCKSRDYFTKTKENPSIAFKKNLKRMFTDDIDTDVDLHAGEKVIRTHKVILCANSPVFLAKFNQKMTKNRRSAIKIPDVEAEILSSLLEYMYTGDIEMQNYERAAELRKSCRITKEL